MAKKTVEQTPAPSFIVTIVSPVDGKLDGDGIFPIQGTDRETTRKTARRFLRSRGVTVKHFLVTTVEGGENWLANPGTIMTAAPVKVTKEDEAEIEAGN